VRGGDTLCACSFMYSVQFGHGGRRCTVDATRGHPRQVSAETATRLTPDHGRPRWAADAAPGGSAARARRDGVIIYTSYMYPRRKSCACLCLRSEVVLL
jgi:hypothetical protein